ncbi:MAG: hypothetical protein GY850_42460 [bacterium]|nr:hypothetical protein [bacterium]
MNITHNVVLTKAKLYGSRAVYTTHRPVGYLPRDVASLGIRHESAWAEYGGTFTRWIAQPCRPLRRSFIFPRRQ